MRWTAMLLVSICVVYCSGQQQPEVSGSAAKGRPKTLLAQRPGPSQTRNLVLAHTIRVKSELASLLYEPLRCDGAGNLYYQTGSYGMPSLRKLSPKGEHLADFRPEANPDMPIDNNTDFAITQSGDIYMLVFPHEITRYVFRFKPDGTYRSSVKLQPGFAWIPYELAVFPSGQMLISGLEYAHEKETLVKVPFTGIFAEDGTLLKQISLDDDDELRNLAATGDPRVTSEQNPGGNRAIAFTKMEMADDGNVYLMRWTNPAIFYAVSTGGAVVRRFTVDPGDPSYRPVSMHVSGNKIAVLFLEGGKARNIMKIVDLEGRDIAAYEE